MTGHNTENTNPQHESHQQLGFIATLPSDIVLEILSMLSQQDCLTCMAVCRDWYFAIPEYTRNVWKDFLLNARIAQDHRRRELCLGNHVKNVIIKPDRASGAEQVKEQELRTLMQKLFGWGCTDIESVGKVHGWNQTSTFGLKALLELIRCATTHLDECLDLLKLIAPHLASLILENHASEVDILHILYAFPDLTRFSCNDYNLPNDDRTLIVRPLSIPADYYSKITQLHLNVALTKAQKESILKRCPDLRSFIDSGRQSTQAQTVTVGLDELFSWCPKISFLETTWVTINERPDPYINDQGGLRFFNTSDDYGVDQIGRLLKKNQGTLEHLIIRQQVLDDDWSRVLGSLHLPNLQRLTSFHNNIDVHTLIALINHCPALVELHLDFRHRLTLGSAAIQSIQPLYRLKVLRLGVMVFDADASLLALLTRFPAVEILVLRQMTLSVATPAHFDSPKYLRSLVMSDIAWNFDDDRDHDKEAEVANLLGCLICNSILDFIQLQRVSIIGHKSLLTIAGIPTLEAVQVDISHVLVEQELLEFVQMLRRTTIISLTLDDARVLSMALFDALTKLPLLRAFSTDSTGFNETVTHISFKGLQHLLRNSPKLATVLFINEIVVEDDENILTRDQLSEHLRTHFDDGPDTKPPRRWEVRNGFRKHRALRNIAIRRMNS